MKLNGHGAGRVSAFLILLIFLLLRSNHVLISVTWPCYIPYLSRKDFKTSSFLDPIILVTCTLK
jgi:hypothetical protein